MQFIDLEQFWKSVRNNEYPFSCWMCFIITALLSFLSENLEILYKKNHFMNWEHFSITLDILLDIHVFHVGMILSLMFFFFQAQEQKQRERSSSKTSKKSEENGDTPSEGLQVLMTSGYDIRELNYLIFNLITFLNLHKIHRFFDPA